MQNPINAGEPCIFPNPSYENRLKKLSSQIDSYKDDTKLNKSLGAKLLLQYKQQLEDLHNQIKAYKEIPIDNEKIVNLFNAVAEKLNSLNPSNKVPMIQKTSFQQKTSTYEKEFIKLLTPKILGHVVGDSFLEDMVSNSGERLEGNQLSTSVEFLISAMDYLPEKYSQEFPDSLKDQIPELRRQFQQAADWAKETEKIITSITDYNDIIPELNKLSSSLNKIVKDLNINESFLLPWGWLNNTETAASGHAMLLEFVKTQDGMLLRVFNTGAGMEFHEIANDATRLYGNTVKEYRVPIDKLGNEFLKCLLEPKILGRLDSVMNSNAPYGALDLYALLAPFEVQSEDARRLTDKMRKMQQSGTCSMRCLFAYIEEKTGAQKAFKNILSREVIKQSLETIKGKKKHPAREIIGKAIPNLFRHLGKVAKTKNVSEDRKKSLLAELENYRQLYHHYYPEALSENQPFIIEDLKPQHQLADEVKQQSEEARKKITQRDNIDKAVLKPDNPMPPITLALDGSILQSQLAQLIKFCENYEEGRSLVSFDILCRLGRIFTNTEYEDQKKQLLESFKDDPDSCYEIIKQIGKLAQIGFENSYNQISFQRTLALHSAIAAIWTLGPIINECDFDSFALPNRFLMPYMQGPLQGGVGSLVPGKEMEDDFRNLAEFFSKDYQKNKPLKPVLFDFEIKFGKLTDVDFNYIKKIYEAHRNEIDFTEADKEFKSQEANGVTKENWRILWLFKNGPWPREYSHLRNLFMLCRAETPFIDNEHFHYRDRHYNNVVAMPQIMCPSSGTVPFLNPEDRLSDFQYENYNKNIESGNYWGLEVADYFRATFPEGQNRIFEFMAPRAGNKQSLFKSSNPAGIGVIDKAHSEIVESLSVKCASIGFQYRMLIDVYKKNLFNLSKPEHQANVSIVMTEAFALSKALQHSPMIGWELRNFLDEALSYFLSLPPEILKNKDKAAVIVFLIDQKQYLLSLMKEHQIPGVEEDLEQTRIAIQDYMNKQDFNLPALKEKLLLAYVNSYIGENTLTASQASSLTFFKAQLAKIRTNYILDFKNHNSEITLVKHIETLRATYENQMNGRAIMNACLNLYGFNLKPDAIVHNSFPILWCEMGKKIYELDVLSGKVKVNKMEFGNLPSHIKQHPDYQRTFGDSNLSVQIKDNVYEASDALGEIRMYAVQKKDNRNYDLIIRRQINGKWFQQCPLTEQMAKLAPNLLLQAWTCIDQGPAETLLIDPKTLQIHYGIDQEGKVKLNNDSAKRYEMLDAAKLRDQLAIFSKAAYILKRDKNDKSQEIILKFPALMDQNRTALEFEKRKIPGQPKERWVLKSNPAFFISETQQIKGIENFAHFLILENNKGEKSALIAKSQINSFEQSNSVEFADYKLTDDYRFAIQTNPEKNAYLAYLLLRKASVPDEYSQAMKFLQACREFRRYTPDELKFLGWVATMDNEKKDSDADAYAVRLFAAWLVHDNFNRFPSKSPITNKQEKNEQIALPGRNDSSDRWVDFWTNTQLQPMNSSVTGTIASNYFARQNNAQNHLKIQNHVDAHSLHKWGLQKAVNLTYQKPDAKLPMPECKALNADLLNAAIAGVKKEFPTFTRQGRAFLDHFIYLYDEYASSDDPKKIEILRSFLNASQGDTFKGNPELRVLLWAKISSNINARKLVKVFEQYRGSRDRNVLMEDLNESFKTFYEDLKKSKISSPEKLQSKTIDTKKKEILPAASSMQLPKNPVQPDLHFEIKKGAFSNLHHVFDGHFSLKSPTKAGPAPTPPFKIDGQPTPFQQKALEEINKSYIEGVKRNQREKGLEIKNNPDIVFKSLLEHKTHWQQQIQANQQTLKNDEQKILNAANSLIDKEFKHRVDVGGLQRQRLNLDDCILLFLQGDTKKFAQQTDLDISDIISLYQEIGQYLQLSVEQNHLKNIYSHLEELEKSDSKTLPEGLKKLGELLSACHPIEDTPNAAAILVFEHKMGLMLRKHQVEGLDEMLSTKDGKLPDIFLQRIQAGGKTLVWGHLMALLKADGFHLSVHVSPSHQYVANLYDMGERSKYIFRQEERTLIFDDDPIYFNKDHLEHMHRGLIKAIHEKEYVNTTSETLRAMRDKYIKGCLDLQNPKLSPEEKQLLRSNLDRLRDILALMRARGVFTFDEVHEAMDPRRVLNMPCGQTVHPSSDYVECISKLLRTAVQASDIEGNPLILLKDNKQAQQTEQHNKLLMKSLLDELLKDVHWREKLSITPDTEKELRNYLSQPNAPLPEYYHILKKNHGSQIGSTDIVILIHQLISGNWLGDSLSKSVSEHFAISKRTDVPQIARPCLANMKIDEDSEFSDQIVMITNTLIAYLVEGLNEAQTSDFIQNLQKQALHELDILRESHPDSSIRDTLSHRKFNDFCKVHGINIELMGFDYSNKGQLETIQKALLSSDSLSMTMLTDYVHQRVLSNVDLFEMQVSSNGQNTATMARTADGYSGTMDNLNMAPVMNSKGRSVTAKPEIGTNGQTLDLLVNKNPDVFVIDSKPESIFTDLINKLPDERKKKVHAIIDVGCHFRGIPNHEVSKLICSQLKYSAIKGVLFFDHSSGKLCFMDKKEPALIKVIGGTQPKKILEETDCTLDELFTYYDQDHITGTDIAQAPDAIAISTINENTPIHHVLQGDRRMRRLEEFQGIITAVQKGSLNKISWALNKPSVADKPIGQVSERNFILDLLLCAHLTEAQEQQKNNLMYCIQKMENMVQQFLLDGIYNKILDPEKVFSQSASLFTKSSLIDLYNEYGKLHTDIPTQKYLEVIKEQLLKQMPREISEQDLENLKNQLDTIIRAAMKDMQPTVDVKNDFGQTGNTSLMAGREETMVRKQENVAITTEVSQVQTKLVTNIQSVKISGDVRKETPIEEQEFYDLAFPIESLQTWMTESGEAASFQIFSPSFFATENFVKWNTLDHINLVGRLRKPVLQVLIVCDESQGTKEWRAILGSVKESEQFAKHLQDKSLCPPGRKIWLVRPHGEIAWEGAFPYDKEEILKDKEARNLLVQTLIYSGDIGNLQKKTWLPYVEEWLKTKNSHERKQIQEFFENKILSPNTSSAYLQSPLCKIIRNYSPPIGGAYPPPRTTETAQTQFPKRTARVSSAAKPTHSSKTPEIARGRKPEPRLLPPGTSGPTRGRTP